MKFTDILTICALVTLVSCETTEEEYNTSRKKFEELGRKLGSLEYSMEHEESPGKAALLAENLRETRSQLADALEKESKIISPEEATKVVEVYKKGMIDFEEESAAKFEALMEGIRKPED